VVIEATGSPLAVVDAFDYARDAGRVVILGQYTDLGEVSFSPHVINRKHLTVLGCWGSDFSHFYRAVEIMARPGNAEKWQRLGTRNYGLPDVNQALTDVAAGSVAKALIRS
jgi:L-iditol 2-dehydrogenase